MQYRCPKVVEAGSAFSKSATEKIHTGQSLAVKRSLFVFVLVV